MSAKSRCRPFSDRYGRKRDLAVTGVRQRRSLSRQRDTRRPGLRQGSERLLNLVVSRALFGTQGPAWTSPLCPSSSTSSSRAPEPDTSTCRGSQPPAGAGRHLRSAHPKHLVNQSAMPLLPDQLLRRSVVRNLQPENGSPLTAPDALPCPEMPSPPPAWSRFVMPEARPPRTNRPATPSPLPTSAPMPRNP